MKVSSITNRTDGKITRSNEFNHVNLYETIPINVAMSKIQDNNEIAEKFAVKQRVIKEISSIGGFRMSKDKLKKREDAKINNANESLGIFPFNPNEENYPNVRNSNYSIGNYKANSQQGKFNQGNLMNSNSLNFNAMTNANSYNMSTNFNVSGKYNTNNFSKNIASEIDYKSLNPHEELSTNLMSILEKEVEKLKKESEEFKKIQSTNKYRKSNTGDLVHEDKVFTNYLCTKDDRMQAIKHVTTQEKPEYMSLEELQKMKEENAKRLLEIENQYYQQKVKAEQRAKNVDDFINREEDKKISIEEINEILRNEEDYFQKDFKSGNKKKNKFIDVDENGKIQKRKFVKRPKSTKNIRRFAEKELDKPLNKNEEKYVKKYVEYVMKKKKFSNPNEDSADDQEDWNKTKILSQNFKGGVNRNDGLTGHLYNDDYSFYYLSINSENTPKSLSLKSFKTAKNSTSKNKNKKLSRKSNDKHLKKNYQLTEDSAVNCNYNMSNDKTFRKSFNQKNPTENSKISNNNVNNIEFQNERTQTYNNHITNNASVNQKSNKSNMNSHLAFGKLIFQLLDKSKSGSVPKVELLKELELDENILVDLGFESQEDLVQKLQEFKSEKEGYLDEQEFIAFLLSRSDLNEEYLDNYRNNNADGNMHEENNYDFDAVADMENIDNKYYQGEEVQYFESENQFLRNRPNTEGNVNNYPLNEEEKISNLKLLVKSELDKEKLEKEREGSMTNFEFLNFNSTGERLSKLRETVSKNAAFNQSAQLSRSNANIQQETDKNYKSQNIGDFNSRLTKSLKKKIHRQENLNSSYSKSYLKSRDAKNIKISYKDYTDFVNRYKISHKSELNFTIPKPFPFMQKDYNQRKLKKMEEILEERKRKEDEILGYRFRANEVKQEIFISQFENIIEEEKFKRKERTEKLKEKIVQEMKPFTFYENDEKKYKEKITRVSEPLQFLPFKANPVPWTSQVNLYEDLVKKSTDKRKKRVEERARETLNNAKLPPRMEMHEKKKKQSEEEMKIMEQENKKKSRCQSAFKAKEVPDFAKKQEDFIKNLERKKSVVKPTEPVPFTFHEPKKKASLRAYLDKENDPQAKSPNFKRNIVDIIHKLQQKPKIEPASNKSLTLLMAARRNELEEKQRMEEKKILEDKMRKEKQERLKERVVSSKALADNKEMLESKRRAQQEAFKKGLIDNKKNYEEELARRLQKVYNKPLMFETSYKSTDKIAKNRNLYDKVYGELNNNESYNANNNYNYTNTEGNVNESSLKHNVSNKISNLKEEDEEYEDKFDDV